VQSVSACVCCNRLMHQVQLKLSTTKNKIDVIVPEQQVLTESLDEVSLYTICS